jgi:hypothetical protein
LIEFIDAVHQEDDPRPLGGGIGEGPDDDPEVIAELAMAVGGTVAFGFGRRGEGELAKDRVGDGRKERRFWHTGEIDVDREKGRVRFFVRGETSFEMQQDGSFAASGPTVEENAVVADRAQNPPDKKLAALFLGPDGQCEAR